MIDNGSPTPPANHENSEPPQRENQVNVVFVILGILCWGYVAFDFLWWCGRGEPLVAVNLINAIPFVVGLYFLMNCSPKK